MNVKSPLFGKSLIVAALTCALGFGPGAQAQQAATPLQQPQAQPLGKVEDYQPDPKKRLTIEMFVKGGNRLHEYLVNALSKADPENKKFLAIEKAEIERQLKNPETALKEQFASIEAQIDRLNKLKLFEPALVAKMRMHFLETEAGKVVGVLIAEKRKPMVSTTVQAEIQYQLGIIAQRDQVNYKTALRHFSNAVQQSPKNVEYLQTLAEIYQTIGDVKDAEKIYTELLVQLKKNNGTKEQIKAVKDKLASLTQHKV